MKHLFSFADRPGLRFTFALIGVVIPLVWLWTLISAEEEMVRIRSALLFEMGELSSFDWSAKNAPATFLSDRTPAAPEFQKIAGELRQASEQSEFEAALAISRYLMTGPSKRTGGPIRENLATTLKQITIDGHGYCADFAKVFNGIAVAAGLPVRQWGFAFDAFGSGHTFNEVYDGARKKWILVDSFHSLYFIDKTSGEPLSTLEVHDRLLSLNNEHGEMNITRIVPSQFPFRSDSVAFDYYRRGMPQLYLVYGNNVFDYEAATGYKLTASLSRPLEELGAIFTGRYPRMVVYPAGVSERDVTELQLHKRRLILAVVACIVATAIFLVQIPGLFRPRNTAN